MKRKLLAIVTSVALASMALSGCGSSGESGGSGSSSSSGAEYTFSVGHINSEDDSWHQAALAFKEYVEENSDGRIAIEVYPNSQLGSEVDMIQSILQQSGCDITFTGESMMTYEEDLGMIGMPYLIQSDEHMDAVLNGEPGQKFESLMEDAGMKVLGTIVRGPRYITSSKKIESVADMQDLVIRTPQSEMTVSAFEATGAKPTPMALNEVFTSLQQGTIQAQENPYAMIYTQSFYEVQDYLIQTAHLRAWVYIAMGSEQFNSLPEDLQQVILDGGAHAQEVEHELFLENEKNYEEQLKEAGMEFVEVDTEEFAETMINAVYPNLTDSQKEIFDSIDALKE